MNLEKEKERVWRILDSMSVEEFDDMLERCGINDIKGCKKDSLLRSKEPRYVDVNQIISNLCENCGAYDHSCMCSDVEELMDMETVDVIEIKEVINLLKSIMVELSNIYRGIRTDENLEWNRAIDKSRSIVNSKILCYTKEPTKKKKK